MRVPNLPLHIERMTHRIEEKRVQDKSHDIDEQHAAHAHACAQNCRRSLSKKTQSTRCRHVAYQQTDQREGREDEQEY